MIFLILQPTMTTIFITLSLINLKHFGELVLEMAAHKTDENSTETLCWRLGCPLTLLDFDYEDRPAWR